MKKIKTGLFFIIGLGGAVAQNGLDSLPLQAQIEEIAVSDSAQTTTDYQPDASLNVQQLRQFFRPTGLADLVSATAGIQQNVACGVCGSNSLNINGLGGQYTAIALDGIPLYGGLAAIYGLNSLPTAIIERVDLRRGAASAYYGSEAVAGLLDVRSKDPSGCGWLGLETQLSSLGEQSHNLNYDYKIGAWLALSALQWQGAHRWQDRNADLFGDLVQYERFSAFQKLLRPRANRPASSLSLRYYQESRRNGLREFLTDRNFSHLAGSGQIYGEFIRTWRAEGSFRHYFNPKNGRFYTEQGAAWHQQRSYYGTNAYLARQFRFFANLVRKYRVENHQLLFLLSGRYDDYDDNSSATSAEGQNQPLRQPVLGLMGEDSWRLGAKTELLGSFRLDYTPAHGLIPSPRLAFNHQFSAAWSVKNSLGTGFRVVNVVAEDHAFVSGQRELIFAEQLRPERSWGYNLAFSYQKKRDKCSLQADFGGFYTRFSNAIIADYSQPNQIIYANLRGFSHTRGGIFSVDYSHQIGLNAQLNGGLTWAEIRQPDPQGRLETTPIPYSNRWQLNLLISQRLGAGWALAYTCKAIGAQFMPTVYDVDNQGNLQPNPRAIQTQPYQIHSALISKKYPIWGLELYAGLDNLLDFVQPISPLAGYNDPNFPVGFSPYFDTAYNYAPLAGRKIYAGLRWFWHLKEQGQ